MPRVKRGVQSKKRKKYILKQVKGFRYGRKSEIKLAKDALRHALTYAYRDRHTKKRNFRRLWNTQINAACRENQISYSRFINGLKKKKIELDRKILAELSKNYPDIFKRVIEEIKEVV